MKSFSLAMATAGALVGIALVMVFKPDSKMIDETALTSPPEKFEGKIRRSAEAVMTSFEGAESAMDRVRIAMEFRRFSSDEFSGLLLREGALDQGWRLNETSRCLLVSWGERDPRAALEWSWKHLKENGKWQYAFTEVVRTWVGNDPVAVIAFYHENKKSDDNLTLAEAKGSEGIVLDRKISQILKRALFSTDSSVALLAMQEGVGSLNFQHPRPMDFTDLLSSAEEVKVEQEKWKDVVGADMVKYSLASRLRELVPTEPEVRPKRVPKYPGLSLPANSKRGPVMQRTDRQGRAWVATKIDFERTVAEAQTLEVAEREAVFLAMYDSWHAAHPGEEPDLTLLPEEARQLWRDLDGLGPIDDSFSSSTWNSEEFEKK